MKKSLMHYTSTITNIVGIVLFGSIFSTSFLDLIIKYKSNYYTIIFNLIVYAVICGITVYICKKIKNEKLFIFILLSFSFILKFIWILSMDTQPDSDFVVMYNAAIEASKSNFTFVNDRYFSLWPYQMGFTLYQSLIIYLFGPSLFILKVFNCIFSTGTIFMVYKITKMLFNKFSAKISALLLVLYIPYTIMNSLLTNQQLATFLFYLGFYVMLKLPHTKKSGQILLGIVFALAHIVRPLATVVIPSVLLYQVIVLICSKGKNRFLIAKKTLVFLLVYSIAFQSLSFILINTGISPHGLKNRDPLWKFVTGLNYSTTGQYSYTDNQHLLQFAIGEERKAEELKLIKERTGNIATLFKLFLKKYYIFWGTKDAFVHWTIGSQNASLVKNIQSTEQSMYMIAILFSVIACIRLLRKKTINHSFFVILISLYAAAHLLIEIQTRYREFIIPAVFIFFGYGLSMSYMIASKKINHYLSRKQKSKSI